MTKTTVTSTLLAAAMMFGGIWLETLFLTAWPQWIWGLLFALCVVVAIAINLPSEERQRWATAHRDAIDWIRHGLLPRSRAEVLAIIYGLVIIFGGIVFLILVFHFGFGW